MPISIRTMGNAEQDREVDELARQIKLLKNQLAALAPSSVLTPSVPVVSGANNTIAVTQVDGTISVDTSTLSFDQTNGFTVTETGGQAVITIAGSGLSSTPPPAIAAAGAAGSSSLGARSDHTHAGESSLNALTGAVTISAGANIVLTPTGNNIAIAATAGGGGVTSVNTAAGALTVVGGSNVTVGTVGTVITINASAGAGSTISVKTTIPFSAFTAIAALSGSVNCGAALPAGCLITSYKYKTSAAFAGPGITNVVGAPIFIDVPGTLTFSATDLFTAPASTKLVRSLAAAAGDQVATNQALFGITCTGANCTALTAGSVDVWLSYLVLI